MVSLSSEFFPDANRAHAMHRAMNDALASSLEHLDSALTAGGLEEASELSNPVSALKSGALFHAQSFVDYYILANAALANEMATVSDAISALQSPRQLPESLEILPYLGPTGDRLSELFSTQVEIDYYGVEPTTSDRAQEFAEQIQDALHWLERVHPPLRAEFDALVRTILVAQDDRGPGERSFGGGSIFSMPGLLFINANRHPNRLELMETLVHESSHSLQFGFCVDTSLTLNDPEATYASPLRQDPRPMEGVYHATFVSARMSFAMDLAAKCDALTAEERAEAQSLADQDAESFYEGMSVITADAELSPIGKALIENAQTYMDGRKAA